MNNEMHRLPKKEGFQIDMRIPKLDGVACSFANKWFGEKFVDKIIDKYHRSEVTHELLLDDLMGYDISYTSGKVRQDPAYQAVLQSVSDDFTSKEKIIPLTLGAAFDHEDFPKDKSPGLPWKTLGFKSKGAVLEDKPSRDKIYRLWDTIGNGREGVGLPDTCAFFRSQLVTRDKNKVRAVWGYPLDVVSEEFRFFYPYMEWLKTADAPVAYGVEMATGGMSYVNEMCKQNPGSRYMLADFSQFDKTVPPWLIRDAFRIVMESIDFSHVLDSVGKVWPVNPMRTLRRVRKLIKYFIDTPVRIASGERFRKTGGVPSGSMFTNIIDTIVNCIVTRYCVYHTIGQFPAGEIYLGDDSFVITGKMLNLEDISNMALESFGMKINPDKSYVTENDSNVQFLGYYNRNGLPYKGNDTLLASFIFPERVIRENEIRISRAVGQMWSTLHSGMAYKWWMLVQDMLSTFGISEETVIGLIRNHPGTFRYLKILGIPIERVVIPESMNYLIPRIDPPWISKRSYKRKIFDPDELWDRSLLHNWH